MTQKHPRKPLPGGLMCLTLETAPIDAIAQARRLSAAGARMVQLRIKTPLPHTTLRKTAEAFVMACHENGALAIINDTVRLALESGADGVHLGREDMPWAEARALLGEDMIIGGTINNPADVVRAREAACLDYVGVGPLRFTGTKKKLAPVLGLGGVTELIEQLGELPAYVIGGVREEDLAGVRVAGAAGVAVCASLHEHGALEANYRRLAGEWISK